ncbi:hypothetical protein CRG98_041005 [Punica granatum]|uniref:Disease resistance N-terminal domain-containing protein n=1 Tax=Punica granatum TaxID=22663 RepID=A0A2I0I3N6_PUNGR|nr:hypothetical protein CRG98_041005 [Punica granatum]
MVARATPQLSGLSFLLSLFLKISQGSTKDLGGFIGRCQLCRQRHQWSTMTSWGGWKATQSGSRGPARDLVLLPLQEIGLACGVKCELEKLQGTVTAIAALLRDAKKGRIEAEVVKDWLQKLKVVVYDADDLLDDFSIEALRRRRVVGGVKRVLNEHPDKHEQYVVGRDEDIKEVSKFLLNPDFEENVSILLTQRITRVTVTDPLIRARILEL